MAVSGIDLKVERVRARVAVAELAARMGITRATLWVIEKSAEVPPEKADRYRAALRDLSDVETVA